jgi:NAD(P)-dependent dehydrogenase (short-subunit alcohol dehydrogenase family)
VTDYGKAFRLDGKVALVTGAARGIGAEIARALAQVGASVLATDVLDEPGGATASGIAQSGGRCEFMHHDVTDETQWEAAVAASVERFGGLDVLVNNAGIETAAFLTKCDASDFRRVMDVNVTGVFLGVKHGVRAMQPGGAAGRGGAIVNMSSIAGMIGTTAHIAYHSSKGAVRSLTKAAAIECAQLGTGIRVNSVHPGIVATDMGDKFVADFVALGLVPDTTTAETAFKAAHPLGFGRPEDVACAVLYLATEASRWTTGTELVVDGGYTAT